ncbi:hypothetical protein V6N13_110102 [Hibiscus sabdariffa]
MVWCLHGLGGCSISYYVKNWRWQERATLEGSVVEQVVRFDGRFLQLCLPLADLHLDHRPYPSVSPESHAD